MSAVVFFLWGYPPNPHAGAGEIWLPRSGHEEVSVQECSDTEGGPHPRWGSLALCLSRSGCVLCSTLEWLLFFCFRFIHFFY